MSGIIPVTFHIHHLNKQQGNNSLYGFHAALDHFLFAMLTAQLGSEPHRDRVRENGIEKDSKRDRERHKTEAERGYVRTVSTNNHKPAEEESFNTRSIYRLPVRPRRRQQAVQTPRVKTSLLLYLRKGADGKLLVGQF